MISRKKFIKNTAWAASLLPFHSVIYNDNSKSLIEAKENYLAQNKTAPLSNYEPFWRVVRSAYAIPENFINLNNGGVSPQSFTVQDKHIEYYKFANQGPSYFMWEKLDAQREPLRKKLADILNCNTEEIAINRNSTEGLNTIIFGMNLQAGDEVILSKYDYPNMMNAWKQRENRDKIRLQWVDLNLPEMDDEVIFQKFASRINEKTKVLHLTHIQNWTGQILPVKQIAEFAHSKGCEVIVDGAHSFAQLNFSIPDLGCDYFAASLHKWLGAPFGSGVLFVKKNKIENIYPLLSAYESQTNDIRKFEMLGTRSFAAEMAIHDAIDFHQILGTDLKRERLCYLKKYWTEQVKNFKNIRFYTDLNPIKSCALTAISLQGTEAEKLTFDLMQQFQIHVTAIRHENLNGIRITPHIYTSLQDLDKLVLALKTLSQ